MNNALLIRKLLEKEIEKLKSSNHYPSDADWHIGFTPDQDTTNESEYDPRTGKVIHNTAVGDQATHLQQWDPEPEGYIEEEEETRDSGTYSYKLNNLFRAYGSKSD